MVWEAPWWWKNAYHKDAPDELDYNAAVMEMREGEGGHWSYFDEPDLWANLLEAAAKVVCNHGAISRETQELIDAVQAVTAEVMPPPPDPLDAVKRRHERLTGRYGDFDD